MKSRFQIDVRPMWSAVMGAQSDLLRPTEGQVRIALRAAKTAIKAQALRLQLNIEIVQDECPKHEIADERDITSRFVCTCNTLLIEIANEGMNRLHASCVFVDRIKHVGNVRPD